MSEVVQQVRLEDICAQITDGKHGDCLNQDNSGYYFLSCKDIADGALTYEGARQITESDFIDTNRRTRLEPLDILITNSGTIGRMALVPNDDRTARTTFQKSVAILKPLCSKVQPHFLYYRLLCDRDRLIAFAGGTAQKNLLLRDLRAFPVELPSLKTQCQIAQTLSAYDDLIENNTRRIKILEQMAQMLYREWFVNFRFPGHEKVKVVESDMGCIPQGWAIVSLAEVTSFIGRGISPTYDDAATGLVINQKCIRDGKLSLGPARRQSKRASEEKMVREGDVLINSTGVGTLGRVAQVVEPIKNCTVDSHVSIVRPERYPEFLGRTLLEMEQYFAAQGVGSTGQTELGRERIGATQVVMPPDALQKGFCRAVAPINKMIACCLRRNEVLRTTRDLLLPKLVSGEISVEQMEKEAVAQMV